MITKDMLPQLLLTLGFTKCKSTFSKTYGPATLEIDPVKETIGYPVL
jgi:hypothetical protein